MISVLKFVIFLCNQVRYLIASFIFYNALGWTLSKGSNLSVNYKSGKHIITYVHTSMYDRLICWLLFELYGIKSISTIQNETLKYLMSDSIFIDKIKNFNTVKTISDDLNQRSSFNFVSDLKHDIYQIAFNTCADINLIHFDFVAHSVTIDTFSNSFVQTVPLDKVKGAIQDKLKSNNHPNNYSIINTKKSICVYVPFIIVFYILYVTV